MCVVDFSMVRECPRGPGADFVWIDFRLRDPGADFTWLVGAWTNPRRPSDANTLKDDAGRRYSYTSLTLIDADRR